MKEAKRKDVLQLSRLRRLIDVVPALVILPAVISAAVPLRHRAGDPRRRPLVRQHDRCSDWYRLWQWGLASLVMLAGSSAAQELEPRSLSNVPVGTNFAVVGYGYARGSILLDPTVPIEDLDGHLHTIFGAYVRSISLLGLSSKIDVLVPFAGGDWTGRLEGEARTRAATGIGDPRVRVSLNFIGAPALKEGEFATYRQKTIVGASLQVFLPVGQYDASKLINLGTNRWIYRPQIGVSQAAGKWIIEAYASTWLFGTNADFYGGNELSQRPLVAAKLHVIRSLARGRWVALSGGYGAGGRSLINGEERDTYIATFRFSLTLAAPISAQQTVKLNLTSGVRKQRGPDFDAIVLSYQYRW